MSNQRLNDFEGLTLKVIGQVVDVDYHGVEIIDTMGNGILGKMIEPIRERKVSTGKQPVTTCSSEVMKLPMAEALVKENTAFIPVIRAMIINDHSDVNSRVEEFHKELNALKKGLLQGKIRNLVKSEDLLRVREAMKPFNVGKVLKIKLQARIFSKDVRPGYNLVSTGGSSTVNVLYTFYMEYVDGEDIQLKTDSIAQLFRRGQQSANIRVNAKALDAVVEQDEHDRITITPQRPAIVITTEDKETGREISQSVEEVRRDKTFSTRATSMFG